MKEWEGDNLKNRYTYEVYDITEQKFVLKNGTLNDVEQAIGISQKNISNYAIRKYPYKGRYDISRTAVYIPEKPKSAESMKRPYAIDMPQRWIDEWNRVRLLINPNAKPNEKKEGDEDNVSGKESIEV